MKTLALLAVVLAAAGCGSSRAAKIETPPQPAKRFAGSELTPPRPAPAIALRDARGRSFTLTASRGSYVLVTFLYTHCPDVCPLIAQNLNAALRETTSKNVSVLAVSVDPKGDTPAAVRAYEKRMRLLPQFHYLIGSRAQLHRTWTAWHVAAVRSRPDLVDHVAYTALIDPQGRERLLYDSSVHASQIVHDLRVLMHGSA
ncbi:MAG TPA: SCO family protein [Gaiellaceae bacterium]